MSEFEYAELYAMSQEAAFMNFTALSTIIFAYLVAGHFMSKNLTKSIAIGMTTIYCIFLFGPLASYFISFDQIYEIIVRYRLDYPEGWVVGGVDTSRFGFMAIGIFPVLTIWVASIYYVHFYVRREYKN